MLTNNAGAISVGNTSYPIPKTSKLEKIGNDTSNFIDLITDLTTQVNLISNKLFGDMPMSNTLSSLNSNNIVHTPAPLGAVNRITDNVESISSWLIELRQAIRELEEKI